MPTKPTGEELEKLTDALLDGFDHNTLTSLTGARLALPLERVTPVAG